MKCIYPFLLPVLAFASCSGSHKEKPDPEMEYIVVSQINTSTHPVQQKFIDALTEQVKAVSANSEVKIDTASLTVLMDSAISMNNERLVMITGVKEEEGDFQFKNISLEYAKTLQEAYTKDFPAAIRILGSKSPDRMELLRKEVVPDLLKIKEGGEKLKIADEQMREKYHIEFETVKPEDQIKNAN